MANLTRWDPFGDRHFGGLTHGMDEWMNRFVRPHRPSDIPAMDISIDVTENDHAYTVRAEIPGVKKEDINVSIDGNYVTIGAEVKRTSEDRKDAKVLREERYFGSVSRAFTLPTDVDAELSQAQYTDGILQLTLPKRQGTQRKQLEIS